MNINECCEKFKKNIILFKKNEHNVFNDYDKRNVGNKIDKSIMLLINNNEWSEFKHDEWKGWGLWMRSITFPFFFASKKKMIQYIINTSRITHNNGSAIIGAIFVAIIGYYLMKKIKLNKIIYKYIIILKKNIIDKYIKKISKWYYAEYLIEKQLCLEIINNYLKNKNNVW